jgi:hypothetical protein
LSRGLHWTQQQYEDYLRRHNLPNGKVVSAPVVESPKRKGRSPNKTETEFGLILEAQKRRGDILFYSYEGFSLRWGDGMRYTPDYIVFVDNAPIKLVEVKGAHIWDRDIVRFKGCRAEWKQWFEFEMHQKKQGSWIRLL